MKKLKVDFINRVISIVTEDKTVIAYMDPKLRKKDFLDFFPSRRIYSSAENVIFDFENCQICLKEPGDSADFADEKKTIKVIKVPSLKDKRERLMETVGWSE